MGCYLTWPSIKLTGTHLNCTMYMIGWIEPLRVHVKCLALQELNTMSLAGSHFNIHLGDERYCESKVSCPRTQHKHSQPVLELALLFPEVSASTMRPLHGLKESLWLWHLHSHHGCFTQSCTMYWDYCFFKLPIFPISLIFFITFHTVLFLCMYSNCIFSIIM